MWHNGLRYKLLNLPPLLAMWISNFLKDRVVQAFVKGTTSRDVTINHGVPQGSPLSPLLYLIFTHDLPPTSKVFRSIFADDLKYVVAGHNLSIIATKLQQSMDDLDVYANQWRIGLNEGKTAKLLFQRSSRYIPDWHITLHGKAIRFVTLAKFWHHFRHHVILHLTLPCYYQPCSSPPSQTPISIYLHPWDITIRLFNTYIRTLIEYGSVATCVANPSRFVQWERLQMRLITKTLDLPNTLNHDILRRHVIENTRQIAVPSQTLVQQILR